MTVKVYIARGGILVKNINTIILFSRWKFSKRGIDEFSPTRNIAGIRVFFLCKNLFHILDYPIQNNCNNSRR